MKTLLLEVCLLFSFVCCITSQDQNCSPAVVERCVHDLQTSGNSFDGPVIFRNESEQLRLCRLQESSLNCIDNYTENCMPELQRQALANTTRPIREYIVEYCSEDSEIRRVYVKHLDCYNQVGDQVRNCTYWLREWKNRVQSLLLPTAERVREVCNIFSDAMTCMSTAVRNECPGEAADLFDSMLDRTRRFMNQLDNCE